MKFNFRKLPHPHYGNYGGGPNFCFGGSCPMPIDGLDAIYKQHDADLRAAKLLFSKELRKTAKKKADRDCVKRSFGKLGKLQRPIYGQFYRWSAALIFTISGFNPF